MIFYYMLVAVVDVLTAVNEDDWQIAAGVDRTRHSRRTSRPGWMIAVLLGLSWQGYHATKSGETKGRPGGALLPADEHPVSSGARNFNGWRTFLRLDVRKAFQPSANDSFSRRGSRRFFVAINRPGCKYEGQDFIETKQI